MTRRINQTEQLFLLAGELLLTPEPRITGFIRQDASGFAYVPVSPDLHDVAASSASPVGIICPDAMRGRSPRQEKPSVNPPCDACGA